MKINEVSAPPIFEPTEKERVADRSKKIFITTIADALTNGLDRQIKFGNVSTTPQNTNAPAGAPAANPAAPADPFAAKRAQAAAAARANMASNPAPVAKPSAPIATAPKKPWNASGPRSPELAAKMQRGGFRENKFYQSVNSIVEGIINIDEDENQGPITISSYIQGLFPSATKSDIFKQPKLAPKLKEFADKIEQTYATDKGKAAIQELVNWGYEILNGLQANRDNPRTNFFSNPSSNTNNRNTPNAENSKFGQAISIIDQLNPKQKKKILSYINSELNPTAAAPNNEKVSIGGQEIKPGDPLYDKIKGNLD